MILSGQSIRKQCLENAMISPFSVLERKDTEKPPPAVGLRD